MGAFGPVHWIVVIVVIALLFGGRGKISSLMGDAAKGVKAFKDGLKDDSEEGQTKPSQSATRSEPGDEPR